MNGGPLAKLAALSADEWRALFAAWWLLPGVARGIRTRGVRAVRERLSPAAAPASAVPAGGQALQRARAIARLVAVAARFCPARVRCLERSLVTEALLRRRGIECVLRFGVRSPASRFEGHAWVEVQGQPLADPGPAGPGITALKPQV